MARYKRDPERWITINGNHVPVFSDGSLGGVYEKIQATGTEEKKEEVDKVEEESQVKVTTINDRLAEDAAKFKENPNIAAKEGWGNGYYQEVKEYLAEQEKNKKVDLSTEGTYKLKGEQAPEDLPRVSDEDAAHNKVVEYDGQKYQTQQVQDWDDDKKESYVAGHEYVPIDPDDKGSFFVSQDGKMYHSGSDYLKEKMNEKQRDDLSKETYDGRSYEELNDAQKRSIDDFLSGKESWSAMQTERGTREAKEIFDKQRAKELYAENKKGSIKVEGNEADVSRTTGISDYKTNLTREQALEEVESQLTNHYKNPESTRGDSPVLMEKDGKYMVARNRDAADFAKMDGWKSSPLDSDEAAKIRERSRSAAKDIENSVSKPSLEDVKGYGYDPHDATGDPTIVKVDGESYYKIGDNKWVRHSNSARSLSSSISDQQLTEKIDNAGKVEVLPSAKSNASPKSIKAGDKEDDMIPWTTSENGEVVRRPRAAIEKDLQSAKDSLERAREMSADSRVSASAKWGPNDFKRKTEEIKKLEGILEKGTAIEEKPSKSIKIGDKEVSVSKSPVARAQDMSEKELRAYVRNNGLTKAYNINMNTRPGGYDYSKQMRVLRDIVADDIAVKEARKKKKK